MAPSFFRTGHGHWDSCGPAGAIIQIVQPGGCFDDSAIRRYRAWARYQQAAGGTDAWQDVGRECAAERFDVSFYTSTQASARAVVIWHDTASQAPAIGGLALAGSG